MVTRGARNRLAEVLGYAQKMPAGAIRGDSDLIQIVDAAMAEAARRSGAWLACRPGCAECCLGPFPITPLDARRLRAGLTRLEAHDAARAVRIRQRAARWMGDDDEPCPALDPETQTCDLYDARPITCRTFGPAVSRGSEAVGVCELCYQGASDEQIAACRVEIDVEGLETALEAEMGERGDTDVASALA